MEFSNSVATSKSMRQSIKTVAKNLVPAWFSKLSFGCLKVLNLEVNKHGLNLAAESNLIG